ncbi:MAG: hypothetical protein ACYDH6_23535 [Acidimicrobiales bacterium]
MQPGGVRFRNDVTVTGHVKLHRVAADVILVSPDSETATSGHLVLVWHDGGHTYGLGVHGTDGAALHLDEALADATQPVSPY